MALPGRLPELGGGMMAERFHFTFGPVQEFVAQARRTRDLWAGSWLLSYLAENAIVAAERAGARIILPAREEGEREVVTMARGDGAERFGGVPNRFTAEASDPVAAAGGGARASRRLAADRRRGVGALRRAGRPPRQRHARDLGAPGGELLGH